MPIELKPAEDFRSGKPGIYLGVPEDEYHAYPAASNSTLFLLEQNPGNVPWSKRAPQIQTDAATDLGSLVHLLALQPELFSSTYVVAPVFDRRSNKGKAEAAAFEWQVQQSGLIVIEDSLKRKADNMVASMMAHPEFHRILTAADLKTEVSILWHDAETGVLCKCRCDTLVPIDGQAIVMDLKTTADIDSVKYSVRDYGYAQQQVHYTEGLKANGFTFVHWYFGFVSSSVQLKRYPVRFIQLRGETVEEAEFKQRKRLRDFAYALKNNDWYGVEEI